MSRSFKDKQAFLKRCKDTAADHRGYILPLDDGDLKALVDERRGASASAPRFGLLRERFSEIVS